MLSKKEVKVEHKVSVAVFTSRDEKWVGEGKRGGMLQRKDGREKGSVCFV